MKQKKIDALVWMVFKSIARPGSSAILGVDDLVEVSKHHNIDKVNIVFYAMKETGLVKDATLHDIDLGAYVSENHIELTQEGLYAVGRFESYSEYKKYKRWKRLKGAVSSNWTINGVVLLLTFIVGILVQSQGVFGWIKGKWKESRNTQTEQKSDSLSHNTDTSDIHKNIHPLPTKKTQ